MTDISVCLGISGSFEGGNGGPRYTLTEGSFDNMGISCGCLQWNAGSGTLQTLLKTTLGGYSVADDQFAPIFAIKDMTPAAAVAYAVKTWVNPASANKNLTSEASALWQQLLGTEQCISAQNTLAQAILDSALAEANRFIPWLAPISDIRISAFFFDLHVQQGSLSKHLPDGTHKPDALTSADSANGQRAVDMATSQGMHKTASAWSAAIAADPLTNVLLHYAYERAMLGNSAYQWDTLSRRGAIAARSGEVHGAWMDFTSVLA